MSETRVPAIPEVPNISDPALRNFLLAIKEVLQVREAQKGDKLDSNVTFRDLIDAGIAADKLGKYSALPSVNGGGSPYVIPTADTINDTSTPPPVEDLQVTPGVGSVYLNWKSSAQKSHAYTEIYRSPINTIPSTPIGRSTGTLFVDKTASGNNYYWARHVSSNGKVGEFTIAKQASPGADPGNIIASMKVNGIDVDGMPFYFVPAEYTAEDGTIVPAGTYMGTALIRNASITTAMIAQATINDLRAGQVTTDYLDANYTKTVNLDAKYATIATLQSSYVTTSYLSANYASIGTITANFATIASLNATNSLLANKISVGSDIQSTNYNQGSTGWKISANGYAEFNGATFHGDVYADNGYFKGDISAAVVKLPAGTITIPKVATGSSATVSKSSSWTTLASKRVTASGGSLVLVASCGITFRDGKAEGRITVDGIAVHTQSVMVTTSVSGSGGGSTRYTAPVVLLDVVDYANVNYSVMVEFQVRYIGDAVDGIAGTNDADASATASCTEPKLVCISAVR